jgi:neutral ceramidase
MRCVRFWMAVSSGLLALAGPADAEDAAWKYGLAQVKITPAKLFWMAGFAARTRPAEGALDDLWVKALALEAPEGRLAVLVTADILGVPKVMYDRISGEIHRRHGLDRGQVMLAGSHTHSGPVLWKALQDIYPLDDKQQALIDEYSGWLEGVLLEAVGEALSRRSPCTLWAGEGTAPFGVNRRTNRESDLPEMLRKGEAPRGPSNHGVPVLAVRSPEGKLEAVVFGYAAHTSALSGNQWSADYAGFARRALEKSHPGARALFHQSCGSDQSAAPRGTLELCEGMGNVLAAAVEKVLSGPMRPVSPRLRTAFTFLSLDFGEQPGKAELEAAAGAGGYRARWAKRLLRQLEAGQTFPKGYPEYPVQAWKLGAEQLWISLGGEVAVEYSLILQKKHGERTWVTGYANDVMAYIPSKRIWEEGGYQAGAFDVYGLPANRWAPDIEDRIVSAVERLVEKVQ